LSFDQNGNLIKEFDPTHEILITYKYDSLDRLVERIEICPGIINESEFYYYEKDKLLNSKRIDSTGFINQTIEYNYENSTLIGENIVSFYKSRNTKNVLKVTYQYDSTGLRVTELRPDSTFMFETQRNEYGGIVYFKMTNSRNNPPPAVWFDYDKNLRIAEYRFLNGAKIVSEKMIYNKIGLILEIQTCDDKHFNFPCSPTYRFYYEYYNK
jgi:YD repeat-containing protein